MKIVTDIERIADQCADISEYIIRLSKLPAIDEPVKLESMIEVMKTMVIDVIDAFVEKDLDMADHATNIAEWVKFIVTGVLTIG